MIEPELHVTADAHGIWATAELIPSSIVSASALLYVETSDVLRLPSSTPMSWYDRDVLADEKLAVVDLVLRQHLQDRRPWISW